MNYDRYFARSQKVFAINISDERDTSVYDSFTGKVVVCDEDKILLRTSYRLFSGDQPHLHAGMQFKLTSEAMGMGVQLRAELVELLSPEELHLKPLGELSVYQRRQSPRADLTLPLLHVPQKSSLAAFKREWRRVVQDLHKPEPPRLKLLPTAINLSAGGLRIDLASEPGHLALVVLELDDGQPPVCAIAELIWQKREEEQNLLRCGHRFVEILKEDQARIAAVVEKLTGTRSASLKQRELLDRMEL